MVVYIRNDPDISKCCVFENFAVYCTAFPLDEGKEAGVCGSLSLRWEVNF